MSVMIITIIINKWLGSYQKSWTTLRIRGLWRSVIHQKINKEHLYNVLELVNLLFCILSFEPLNDSFHRWKKPRKNEWLAQGYLVPKWPSYNPNPGPLVPRSVCFPLHLSEKELKSQLLLHQTPIVVQLLIALSRWETVQEMAHPPQKSSCLLGGVKQVLSPELHTSLGQEAKST